MKLSEHARLSGSSRQERLLEADLGEAEFGKANLQHKHYMIVIKRIFHCASMCCPVLLKKSFEARRFMGLSS